MPQTRIASAVAQQQSLLDPFFLNHQELLADFAHHLATTFQRGGRLFLVGSGPFAALAGLLGQQLLHRQTLERPALPAIALTNDAGLASFLAADDLSSQLFSRQLRAMASEQDSILLLSGPFLSPAEREALTTARQIGCSTALICSDRTEIPEPPPERLLQLPTDSIPRLLEGCLFTGHLLCALVEGELFGIWALPDDPVALDLRDRIAADSGPEGDLMPGILAALCREKLTGHDETVYSSKVLMELLSGGLADLPVRRDEEVINYLLTRVCGRELPLAELG